MRTRTLGIILLTGVACFWMGRLTGKPEAKIITKGTFVEPDCIEALCATLYPCPAVYRGHSYQYNNNISLDFQDADSKKAE